MAEKNVKLALNNNHSLTLFFSTSFDFMIFVE